MLHFAAAVWVAFLAIAVITWIAARRRARMRMKDLERHGAI